MTKPLGDNVLDARGLRCPEPVMLLHKHIATVDTGQCFKVLATDPTTERDIRQFCRFLGHSLEEATQEDGVYIYVLRKGG
ncbi:MAG: sulfurtransferase TusA [Congregibacter sp.]